MYYNNYSEKDLDGEVWKEIIGYEGLYSVSNLGRVKSIKNNKNKIRKIRLSKRNGYVEVDLYKNNKSIYYKVHRIVAQTFLGDIPKGYVVKHLDNIKTNNMSWNLEIDTIKNNTLDAISDGLVSNNGYKRYIWKLINLEGEVVKECDSAYKLSQYVGYSGHRQVIDNFHKKRAIGLDNEFNSFTIDRIEDLKQGGEN